MNSHLLWGELQKIREVPVLEYARSVKQFKAGVDCAFQFHNYVHSVVVAELLQEAEVDVSGTSIVCVFI